MDNVGELEAARKELAGEDGQRGVHLAHVVTSSKLPGQKYDIFVYLVGWARESHKDPSDLSDIVKAEFWLGPKFTPSGQTVLNRPDRGDRRIGITTSAYGRALCVCRVTFEGGPAIYSPGVRGCSHGTGSVTGSIRSSVPERSTFP